jgi:hypothetical protein
MSLDRKTEQPLRYGTASVGGYDQTAARILRFLRTLHDNRFAGHLRL